MAKRKYVAVLERGPEGFGVFFPDLPGCVTAGETADAAIVDAREVLTLHLEGMREEGLEWPAPSGFEAFGSDDFPDSEVISLLFVETDVAEAERETPKRINVSLPPSLIARVDAAADRQGLTRSGLLAIAARAWLAANPGRAA